jgi:hypothetical protein
VSTPLLLPLEVRERTKTINAANGKPRSLVKSFGDFFFSGAIFLGIISRIFSKIVSNWHEFSFQVLFHNFTFFQ